MMIDYFLTRMTLIIQVFAITMMASSMDKTAGPLQDLCEGVDPSPTNVRTADPKKELDR